MTKTTIRFPDWQGFIAKLVKRLERSRQAAKRAEREWFAASSEITRWFWGIKRGWHLDRERHLLERARTATAAMITVAGITKLNEKIEVDDHFSQGFRPAEPHELRHLAQDLDAGDHLWFSIQEA